jgi:hypothetical protein
VTRALGLVLHGALMLVVTLAFALAGRALRGVSVAVLAFTLGGCASTFTVAFGEHSVARLNSPQAVCPTNSATVGSLAVAPAVLGTKKTVREERDGKVGPDDVVTVTTTEPVLAPVPEPVPAAESRGAKISSAGKSVLGSLFGVLRAVGCIGTLGALCGR